MMSLLYLSIMVYTPVLISSNTDDIGVDGIDVDGIDVDDIDTDNS